MDDSEKGPRGGILVGVQPGLPDAVLHEAARLARDLHVETRTLEDVFLDLTGRELRT